MSSSRFIVLSDSAPYLNGGRGCNILCHHFLTHLRGECEQVYARRPFPARDRAECPVRSRVYWSADGWGVGRVSPRLKGRLDLHLAQVFSRLHRPPKTATRLFAFCGADWTFLPVAASIARRWRLPYDLYLVDDFESSLRLAGTSEADIREAVAVEARVLRGAARVFAISPGYCDHLKAKYGVTATWLPVPVAEVPVEYRPFGPDPIAGAGSYVKRIVFIGSVNELYESALQGIAELLVARNARGERWQLEIITKADPALYPVLRENPAVGFRSAANHDQLMDWLRRAYALVVPYAQDAERGAGRHDGGIRRSRPTCRAGSPNPAMHDAVGVMVRTSFPTKLTDCLTAGRPVLIHGPAESTIVRYAERAGFPLVSRTLAELDRNLDAIGAHDRAATIATYREAVRRWHSAPALREILLEGAS